VDRGRPLLLFALSAALASACGLGARGTAPGTTTDGDDASIPPPHLPESGVLPDGSNEDDDAGDAAIDDAATDADAGADAGDAGVGVDAGIDAGGDAGFPGPFDCNGADVTGCASDCAGKPAACVFCKNGTNAKRGFCRATVAECNSPPASYGLCP
jgi:hypothetical protein